MVTIIETTYFRPVSGLNQAGLVLRQAGSRANQRD